jgi:hypothetical protein
MTVMIYVYQAVSGAAVWGMPGDIRDAKDRVRNLRSKYPEAEIERIAYVGFNGRRYWRWRSKKWTTEFWTDPSPADLTRWN